MEPNLTSEPLEARASFSGYGTACGDELLLENVQPLGTGITRRAQSLPVCLKDPVFVHV